MQRLVDRDAVAALRHVASKGESGGSAAHNCHLDAVCGGFFLVGRTVVARPVGYEAFQIAYRHGFVFHLGVYATALTLLFLGADASANCRKRAGLFYHTGCLGKLAALHVFDKSGNVDAHRAACDALWVGAVKTPRGFCHSHLNRQPLIHFLIARHAVVCRKLGHLHSRCRGAFLSCLCLAQSLAPFCHTHIFCLFHVSSCFRCRKRAGASSSGRNQPDARQIPARRCRRSAYGRLR